MKMERERDSARQAQRGRKLDREALITTERGNRAEGRGVCDGGDKTRGRHTDLGKEEAGRKIPKDGNSSGLSQRDLESWR
jgi:hypothetical protein